MTSAYYLYYFTDRILKIGFNNTLGNHHINHAYSKLTIKPNFPEFGNESECINEILNEMTVIYARLNNRYVFKNQTVFPTKYNKEDEDGQMLDGIEL